MKKIILASQSPRRQQLLQWADIDFEVMVSDVDETMPLQMGFSEAAVHIARRKGKAIQALKGKSQLILSADTIVICDDKVLGKPENAKHAFETLKFLSNKTHQVITGVCILGEKQEVEFAEITEVTFYPLTDEQIQYYISNYQPYDKAGAYAIQEWIGVVGIKWINGDFYNVMGLPVSRVVRELEKFKT